MELPKYRYYPGKASNCVNLGYCSESQPINEVRIMFDDAGIYDFSDFEILTLPTRQLCYEMKQLSESRLENVVFGTNAIDGKVTLNKDGILCIPIPYLEGWSARIDGKTAPILKGNLMYMALELSGGQHDISLRYRTPFF